MNQHVRCNLQTKQPRSLNLTTEVLMIPALALKTKGANDEFRHATWRASRASGIDATC